MYNIWDTELTAHITGVSWRRGSRVAFACRSTWSASIWMGSSFLKYETLKKCLSHILLIILLLERRAVQTLISSLHCILLLSPSVWQTEIITDTCYTSCKTDMRVISSNNQCTGIELTANIDYIISANLPCVGSNNNVLVVTDAARHCSCLNLHKQTNTKRKAKPYLALNGFRQNSRTNNSCKDSGLQLCKIQNKMKLYNKCVVFQRQSWHEAERERDTVFILPLVSDVCLVLWSELVEEGRIWIFFFLKCPTLVENFLIVCRCFVCSAKLIFPHRVLKGDFSLVVLHQLTFNTENPES